MFARLTLAQIKTGRIDQFIKLFEESIVPAAKSQKGYCGAYLLVDSKTGQRVSITLWNSEEDAIANEKSRYYQEQVAKSLTYYTKPPIREGYEVAVQK
ncbi:MAG: antibiotic biosynthesis monooxygenase [Candidatus Aminicenantes bacterium]|nr:MAG: antibiotic biosynthesis monooxygenase [Candidatus Aminicenantes bacterium]